MTFSNAFLLSLYGLNKLENYFVFPQQSVLLDFSLTVMMATLIFISGCGSAISSAKEGILGFYL